MRVKTPPRKVFQYRKADYEGMKQELKAFKEEFDELAKTEDVEQLWTRFKKKVHALMGSYIPAKTLNGNKVHKLWISKQVKSLTRKCRKLFQRQRKTRKTKDIRLYKETKARLQKTERQSYWKFIDNIIEVGDPDQEHQPKQKRFWAYIKSLRKDSSGIAPLKDNRTLHANAKDKADILNRQYESTWTREDNTSIPTPDGTPFPSMPEIKVTCEGVRKLLQKLNPGKSCGPDLLPARVLKELASDISPFLTAIFQKSLDTGRKLLQKLNPGKSCGPDVLPARVLKELASDISPFLTAIFQKSLDTSYVPKHWRSANVTAIFKKGEKFKASIYRPVSLTSICCKIQEHVITRNVLKHLDENKILTDCQHGFRARRSCETQLLTLAQELVEGLDRK